jgi:hypothetical protein
MLKRARERRCLRWAFSIVACLFAAQAWGQADDCTQLPEARQAMCWMVLSCSTLEDTESRQECFEAAYEGFRATTQTEVAAESVHEDAAPSVPAKVTDSAPVPDSVPVPRSDPDPVRIETQSPVAREKPQQSISVVETVVETTVTVLQIPERFSGEVTVHRKLVRDRQILVLDDKLLFEGDGASATRLAVGDRVDVRRTRSFGVFGNRYEITGRSGVRFTASRVRCEATDLGPDSQRKCAALLP